jgi:hypothetical protein
LHLGSFAVADDPGCGARRQDLPSDHNDETITLLGLLHVVSGDKRSGTPARHLPDLLPQPGAAERPGPRSGLIEYQQLWPAGKGDRERDLALGTERKSRDQLAAPRGDDLGRLAPGSSSLWAQPERAQIKECRCPMFGLSTT